MSICSETCKLGDIVSCNGGILSSPTKCDDCNMEEDKRFPRYTVAPSDLTAQSPHQNTHRLIDSTTNDIAECQMILTWLRQLQSWLDWDESNCWHSTSNYWRLSFQMLPIILLVCTITGVSLEAGLLATCGYYWVQPNILLLFTITPHLKDGSS